jgi:molecular chaperone DnaJ
VAAKKRSLLTNPRAVKPAEAPGRNPMLARVLPDLRGRGQVISSRGIFSIAQTCPQCQGAGRTVDKPCRACRGTGRKEKSSKIKLRIPAGVDAGSRLRSAGNGEAGFGGGPPAISMSCCM